MFIGIRDMLYARGRFALIATVIALMTFMVVMLSALTSGLQDQSISAIERLPGQAMLLQPGADGQQPSLAQSTLDDGTAAAVFDRYQHDASALGISNSRVSIGAKALPAAIFGADSRLMPTPSDGEQPGPDGILLDSTTAGDLGVTIGDTVTVGSQSLRVTGIGDTGSYAHTPVVYTTVDTWRQISHSTGVSAIVVAADDGSVDGTASLAMSKAVGAVPGYSSEHKSLLAMQGMLLAISALVIGAFFTVWTMQRLRDLSVVRAIGGSSGYLLRDSLSQALLVLAIGEAIGTAAGIGLALTASGAVPIALTTTAIALPLVAMTALGMAGALVAVRKVTTVDPLIAMSR